MMSSSIVRNLKARKAANVSATGEFTHADLEEGVKRVLATWNGDKTDVIDMIALDLIEGGVSVKRLAESSIALVTNRGVSEDVEHSEVVSVLGIEFYKKLFGDHPVALRQLARLMTGTLEIAFGALMSSATNEEERLRYRQNLEALVKATSSKTLSTADRVRSRVDLDAEQRWSINADADAD